MALPADLAVVTVNGTLTYTDGTPVDAATTVTFTPTGASLFRDPGDALIVAKPLVCTVNGTGQIVGPSGAVGSGGIGVKLPATDDTDMVPTGSTYSVKITIPNVPVDPFLVSLPSTPTTVDLADLTPVQVLPTVGAPITQAQADARYQRYFAPVPLTPDGSGNINTDASLGYHFRATLGSACTLNNPTNGVDGQRVEWQVKQDATGGRTLTLGSKFRLNADIGSVTLSTGAGKLDSMVAQYHAADDKWDVLGLIKGA